MMNAKKKLTWLWGFPLVLVLLVGLLSTTALAAEPAAPDFDGSTIYANGFPILIEAGETSGTTVKYDSDKTDPYDYETVFTANNENTLTIYAGGNAKSFDSASVLMRGGNVGTIYGGGYVYGSGGSSVGSVEITIDGGNVGTIYGGGHGRYVSNDGGSGSNVTTATITVNGGAVNTLYASSPQAGRECSYSVASAIISVTGGTISNIKENAGKSQNAYGNTVTVTSYVITGGSIASSNISLMPTNGETPPQNVEKKEITLKDKDEANPVNNESLSALTIDEGYAYGMNDVKTDANGKIYVWLPEGKSVSGAESESGDEYEAGSPGVLKKKPSYTVTFQGGGGTTGDAPTQANTADGDAFTLPANPFQKTGYTFAGWSDGNATYQAGDSYSMPDHNVTFTAQWTANTDTPYTVKHFKQNLDGSYPTSPTETDNLTGTTDTSVTPAVKSYTGFTAPSAQTVTILANGSLVVEYKYARTTHTVTWKNGDTIVETDEDVRYGAEPSFSGTTPAKTADAQYTYTFKGWADSPQNAADGTIVDSLPTVTGDVTYYAAFSKTEKTFTVTWKTQSGTGTLETDTDVEYNAAPSFDGTDPTKDEDAQYTYTFAGWAISTNQESGTYEGSLSPVTDNVTYYAAFSKTERSYSVTLTTNGGTINSGNVTTYTYGTGATLPTPTKTGYTFVGWYTDSGFTSDAVTEISTTDTGDKTFYAKWTPTPATAPTLGTISNLSLTYGYTDGSLSVTATTAAGHTITGYQWYSNPTNSNTSGTLIDGATGSSYIPTGKSAGTTEYYYCVVTATRTDNGQTATATSNAAKLEVGKLTINVTAASKSSRVGQDLVPLTYTYTPELIGSDAFTGALATDANKDTVRSDYTITQGTLALDSSKYTLIFNGGTYSVVAKDTQDNFKFAATTQTKTYGNADFTIAATGAETGSTVTYTSSDTSVATVDNSGTVHILKAGTTTITATASETATHAQATATYTLTVGKATITVTAVNQSIYVGDAAPVLSPAVLGTHYTVTGLVNSETLETAPTVSYASEPNTSAAGTVAINVSGAVAPDGDNYDISYVPGTLTISARPVAPSGGGGGGSSAPSVSDKAAKALKDAKEGSTVTIDMKGETKLPASVAKEIAGKDVTVELNMGGGAVWSFSGLDVPKGGVSLNLGVKTGTKNIPTKIINALTGEAATVEFQLSHNGAFGLTLQLSLDLDKQYDGLFANLYYYNTDSGELEFQGTGVISNGKASWPFDHASEYAIVIDENSHEPVQFTDVADDAYYAPAVKWAAAKGITGGIGNNLFAPNQPCTRAQIVTFLWRAAGCPEPADMGSFTDISADTYYAKAVAWAAEQGITGGTGDGKFSPNAVCTRSQSMTFIYRSEQAQGGGMQGEWMFLNPFTDVNLEDYYGEAVMWAVANGVTSGTTNTTFSPNATCTRGQIVTFLYRFFVK